MRFSIILFLLLSACHKEEIDSLKQEIHELRNEVREIAQVKYEVEDLKQKFKTAPMTTQPENLAVIAKKLKSSSSELDDPFLGNKDAQVVLMMFTDHQCKLCNTFLSSNLEKIKKDYTANKKIKFILRDHPLSSNAQSFSAANYTNCAGEQGKYWEALHVLFDNPDMLEKAEYKQISNKIKGIDSNKILRCTNRNRYEKEIEKDREDAENLGITGVPSFYVGKIQNAEYAGSLIRGAQPYNLIKAEIDKVLKSE